MQFDETIGYYKAALKHVHTVAVFSPFSATVAVFGDSKTATVALFCDSHRFR